jgi:hypothetical protein
MTQYWIQKTIAQKEVSLELGLDPDIAHWTFVLDQEML